MRFARAGLSIGIALGLPAAIPAQAPPLDANDFQVNNYTTGAQEQPSVAGGADGSFIVSWTGSYLDGSSSLILGRTFQGLGIGGGDTFVNTYTTGRQQTSCVARFPGGGYVIVWESDGQDGSGRGIYGQRYDGAANPVGSEFLVNFATNGDQYNPRVAADPDGNFVVVWDEYPYATTASNFVSGQKFDPSGVRVGSEFQLPTSRNIQAFPQVAANRDGFLVVWSQPSADGRIIPGILAQRFDAAAQKAGGQFAVPSYAAGSQFNPAIASGPAGSYIVVWQSSRNHDGSAGNPIYGQRFNTSIERVGPEFLLSPEGDTTLRLQNSVAVDERGKILATWACKESGVDLDICGQKLDASGAKLGYQFIVNTQTADYQHHPAAASDGLGFVVVWRDLVHDGSSSGVFGRRQAFVAEPARVDVHSGAGTSSDLNGVLEPGEAVLVEPAWKRTFFLNHALPVTGTAVLSGPPGPIYLTNDSAADYGDSNGNADQNCYDATAGHDCYLVSIAGTRPGTHWDAALTETISYSGTAGTEIRSLHVGDSFSDVPRSQPFYAKIETVLHYGVTSGCTPTTYCPGDPVSRSQMAIFIAKGIAQRGDNVPSSGTMLGSAYSCQAGGLSLFLDVAPTDPFCRHVHYIGAQGVTLGCGVATYCPQNVVTRDAMASFIAKAIVAPRGGGAIPETYSDPTTLRSYSCSAGAPNVHFTDVPASNGFCKHVHYLWAKGVVSGCTATTYCPTQPVARDAMAKFIANGFGLALYGP